MGGWVEEREEQRWVGEWVGGWVGRTKGGPHVLEVGEEEVEDVTRRTRLGVENLLVGGLGWGVVCFEHVVGWVGGWVGGWKGK